MQINAETGRVIWTPALTGPFPVTAAIIDATVLRYTLDKYRMLRK